MLTGQLFITNNVETLKQMMMQSRVVFICEPAPQLVSDTNGVVASVLMPPYSAVNAMLDNDMNTFGNLYFQHLCQKESSNFIAVIIKALMLGTNITLYLSQEESELPYSDILLEYIKNLYGMIVGSVNNPFYYDQNYNATILSLLYSFDLMTVKDFFCLYPVGAQFNSSIIMKLVDELQPYMDENNRTLEGYMHYFYTYKESIKANNNKFLINPISYGR